MPDSAIKTGVVDYVLPLEKIAPVLICLVKGDK
jgi:CheB methylesterase.